MYTTTNYQPLSILTVDDSNSERLLLNATLQKMGHHVESVSSGIEALEYLKEKLLEIDLILLDIRMPILNGLDTAKKIRELEKKKDESWRPIIFLSGLSDTKMIELGVAAGGDDYLTKPVDRVLLQAKITAMQRIAIMQNELINIRQKVEVLANTDELTQLPNRRHFMTILEKELARAQRRKSALSVAYMDLDYFKQINDKYGHEAGDRVLNAVAKVLKKHLRAEDSIGRIGGEEFSICFSGSDRDNSFKACERYRKLIKDLSIPNQAESISVTASFGLTSFQPENDNVSQLLDRADLALYKAKENGRNRTEIT